MCERGGGGGGVGKVNPQMGVKKDQGHLCSREKWSNCLLM